MKNLFNLIFLFLLISCTQYEVEKIPTAVTTINVTNITTTSLVCSGEMQSDNFNIYRCGVCWSTSENPTIEDNYESIGKSFNFTIKCTNLKSNTKYYLRAYVQEWISIYEKPDTLKITYGNQVFATTLTSIETDAILSFNDNIIKNDNYITYNNMQIKDSAYLFNGINSSIKIADSDSLDFSDDVLSISFWLKISDYPNSNFEKVLISKYSGIGATVSGFMIVLGTDNHLLYRYADVKSTGGWGVIRLDDLLPLNKWNHIVISTNKGIDKIYLDGKLIKEYDRHNFHIGYNNSPLWIGSGPNQNTFNGYFNGFMRNIYFFKKELNLSEIGYLFRK